MPLSARNLFSANSANKVPIWISTSLFKCCRPSFSSLPALTRTELISVMTSGMAHVSRGIMAAYIAFGIEPKHLLSAVIMTAPGTILMSKMLVPETEVPKTAGRVVMSKEEVDAEKKENLLGAIARGTTDGLCLALNIAAMLIAFLALIALANGVLGGIHNRLG